VLLAQLELLRLQARSDPLPPRIVQSFERLIQQLSAHYGEQSVVVAGALAASAPAALRAGEEAQALDALRRAAAVFDKSLGSEHARSLRAKFNLAQALIASRQFEEAEALLAAVQTQLHAQFGEGVPMALTVGLRRAVVLAHLQRHAAARDQLDAVGRALDARPDSERLQAALDQTRVEVEALGCREDGRRDRAGCAPVPAP
jgi:tetratricopeptide (TPR) repeat protein